MFDGPFGTGYPIKDAERKRYDTNILKQMNSTVKLDWADIIDKLDQDLLKNALSNNVVYDYIIQNSDNEELKELIQFHC